MMLPDPAKSRAVLIGVHTYEALPGITPLADRPAIKRNLIGLAEVFTDPEIWGLPQEHCVRLAQPDSGRVLMDTVRQAAAEATDTLVVYYSGHGLLNPADEELYLALPDSNAKWVEDALRFQTLRQTLVHRDNRALRTVLILDCCYSGRALDSALGAAEDLLDKMVIEGACVLTASAATERAVSPPGEEYTAFTGELISLLRTGVSGAEPVLTIDLVFEQLRTAMKAKSRPAPKLSVRDGGSRIVLARNRAHAPAPETAVVPVPQAAAPRPMVINTLILPPRGMVGRHRDLAELTEIAQTAGGELGPVVCLLHGMGGVGKTALARTLADRVSHLFPDDLIQIDLNGFTPGERPRAPDEVLGELFAHVGISAAELPRTLSGRSEAWRNRLAAQRILLVLDNAASEEQVRPLLPGRGSASLALITSRHRLDELESVSRFPVEVLAAEDAVTLLRTMGRQENLTNADLVGIAELCGHLPLALRSVGALLRDIESADVLSAMRDAGHPLRHFERGEHAVRTAFTVSFAELPPELRRTLTACARHPGPDFDNGSVGALLGIQPAVASVRLASLVQRSMLLEKNRRYFFHNLFLHHAREEAAVSDPGEEFMRLQTHLLDTVRKALAWVDESQESPGQGTDFGDAAAARRWLARACGELEAVAEAGLGTASEQSWDLGREVCRWLRIDGQPVQARTLGLLMLNRCGDDLPRRASLLLDLGEAARLEHDHESAMNYYDQARSIFDGRSDTRGTICCLIGIAATRLASGLLDEAERAYSRALELSTDHGHDRERCQALIGLGNLAVASAAYQDSVAVFEEALGICPPERFPSIQAYLLSSLGYAYLALSDPDKAMISLEEALAIYERTGDLRGQAAVLAGLGMTVHTKGDPAGANTHYSRALSLFDDLGDQKNRTRLLAAMGESG